MLCIVIYFMLGPFRSPSTSRGQRLKSTKVRPTNNGLLLFQLFFNGLLVASLMAASRVLWGFLTRFRYFSLI